MKLKVISLYVIGLLNWFLCTILTCSCPTKLKANKLCCLIHIFAWKGLAVRLPIGQVRVFCCICSTMLRWWRVTGDGSLPGRSFFLCRLVQPLQYWYLQRTSPQNQLVSWGSARINRCRKLVGSNHCHSKVQDAAHQLTEKPTRVTRMANSPRLWLMAIGWWNKIN